MRKYDRIIAASLLTYLVMAILLVFIGRDENVREDAGYKVEINQIMQGLEKAGTFSEPDLREMQYVKAVSFLPAEPAPQIEQETDSASQTEQETDSAPQTEQETDSAPQTEQETDSVPQTEQETDSASQTELTQKLTQVSVQEISAFYKNHNRVNSMVYPLIIGDRLTGYVRFDYTAGTGNRRILWLAEGVLSVSWLMILAVLWYIRQKVIKPFHAVSKMPYELAKGHMQVDVEENRGRFFGRFVWGIAMLRDTLNASKEKALRLEKEKKLMLLSISHDIKIPLSAIKLYAKALREEIYETEEQRIHAASQIEDHAQEIEEFVKKIMSTASEDILEIEVADSEFYLRDYVDKIREIYEPKCRLAMVDLAVGKYENKLLRGDIDRAVEVMENLLENAMKYGDGQRIRLDFYEEDYCQVIEVFNTGIPVEQKEIPHLFDSFYRGGNAQDKAGNGLGLYIGRQIMLKMEGDIFVKRTESGMCFGIVFRM